MLVLYLEVISSSMTTVGAWKIQEFLKNQENHLNEAERLCYSMHYVFVLLEGFYNLNLLFNLIYVI